MAGRTVVLTGDKEVDRKLLALKTTKMKAVVRRGTRAGAKLVQADAKLRFPKDTGAAARSLKVRALPRSRRWIGHQVTTKVFYAGHVEYGTRHIVAREKLKESAKLMRAAAVAEARRVIRAELGLP